MELTQTHRHILKYLFGLTLLIMFTGPVLICIGIALYVVPSDRPDKIDQYNAALAAYDTTGISTWANAADVNGDALAAESRPVVIYGDQHDVKYYTASVVSASTAANTQFAFNIPDASFTETRTGVTQSKTRSSLAVCETAGGCTMADMQTYCVTTFGSGSTFTGPGDCQNGLCYECEHTVFLTEYCIVLQQSASVATDFIADPNHASCFYPFTANSQRFESDTQGAVIVTVRKSNDPFITLQRVTEGRMDFGAKVQHERMAGYGLLIAGILMTLIMLFMIYMLKSTYNEIIEEEAETEARKIKSGSPSSSPAHHE